jgi:hypothetical protein
MLSVCLNGTSCLSEGGEHHREDRPLTVPQHGALADGFAADLLLDWIPDAIGAVDVVRALRAGYAPVMQSAEADQIVVELAKRSERIPVIDVALRARLHWLVVEALADHTPAAGVFSYRSPVPDYREAYRARAVRLRTLSADLRHPLVLIADVHRFSASLPLEAVLRQPWMTPALATELTALATVAGRCHLPGHLWANRIGMAVLASLDVALDAAVGPRWVRWSDDIHVFVTDTDEAERIRELIAKELGRLQLRLSDAKTGIHPAGTPLRGPARDVAGEPVEVWRQGVVNDDMRALRYALPRLGALRDRTALADLVAVTASHPYLLPRAISYLDGFANMAEGARTFRQLLERESAPWLVARLLALALRHPALLSTVPDSTIRAAAESNVLGLRALAWRADFERGNVMSAPTARLAVWMQGNRRGADLPSVETLL